MSHLVTFVLLCVYALDDVQEYYIITIQQNEVNFSEEYLYIIYILQQI